MGDIESRIESLENNVVARLGALETNAKELFKAVGTLQGQVESLVGKGTNNQSINPTVQLVINKVVFPLIIVLGGLAGVNLAT